MYFLRYRRSQVEALGWPMHYISYVKYTEEYDYDSYNDDGSFGQSDFDYNQHFGNLTFDYTEFTKRAGFVLDNDTLLECTWRGRNCSVQVSGQSAFDISV